MLFYAAIQATYCRSGTQWTAAGNIRPRPLRLTSLDYIKALICWLDAFKQTYAIEPGLTTPVITTILTHLCSLPRIIF
jgi:hypothetical protein